MSLFPLIRPTDAPSPVLVEVPHAGLEIPDDVAEQIESTHRAILRDSDIYVNRLFDRAPSFGATMLSTRVSRYVVDLNRAAHDVDAGAVPEHPQAANGTRGVVWRSATDGAPILRKPLSVDQFQHRMARYYAPYHSVLQQEIHRLRQEHGFVIVVAGHSMPSRGKASYPESAPHRADVVPGTRGRTSAGPVVIDALDAHFREASLEVKHDIPYRGGWTTAHYGRPDEGVHVVQIELNRRLYVDEQTLEVRATEFGALKDVLDGLVRVLGALEL